MMNSWNWWCVLTHEMSLVHMSSSEIIRMKAWTSFIWTTSCPSYECSSWVSSWNVLTHISASELIRIKALPSFISTTSCPSYQRRHVPHTNDVMSLIWMQHLGELMKCLDSYAGHELIRVHMNESIAPFIHMTDSTSFIWETWLHSWETWLYSIWGTWAHQSSYECKHCPRMKVLPPSFIWRTWLHSYEKQNFIFGRNMTSFHFIWVTWARQSAYEWKHCPLHSFWRTWLHSYEKLNFISYEEHELIRVHMNESIAPFIHVADRTSFIWETWLHLLKTPDIWESSWNVWIHMMNPWNVMTH